MKSKIGQAGSNEDSVGTRDAVHVPVVLVTAHDKIKAGDNVRFADDTYKMVVKTEKSRRHAIVDPFLPDNFNITNSFLVMLVPDATLKLVHHYDLAFTDVPKAYVEPIEDNDDEDNGCRGCY
jgi:hypothetical protein